MEEEGAELQLARSTGLIASYSQRKMREVSSRPRNEIPRAGMQWVEKGVWSVTRRWQIDEELEQILHSFVPIRTLNRLVSEEGEGPFDQELEARPFATTKRKRASFELVEWEVWLSNPL